MLLKNTFNTNSFSNTLEIQRQIMLDYEEDVKNIQLG